MNIKGFLLTLLTASLFLTIPANADPKVEMNAFDEGLVSEVEFRGFRFELPDYMELVTEDDFLLAYATTESDDIFMTVMSSNFIDVLELSEIEEDVITGFKDGLPDIFYENIAYFFIGAQTPYDIKDTKFCIAYNDFPADNLLCGLCETIGKAASDDFNIHCLYSIAMMPDTFDFIAFSLYQPISSDISCVKDFRWMSDSIKPENVSKETTQEPREETIVGSKITRSHDFHHETNAVYYVGDFSVEIPASWKATEDINGGYLFDFGDNESPARMNIISIELLNEGSNISSMEDFLPWAGQIITNVLDEDEILFNAIRLEDNGSYWGEKCYSINKSGYDDAYDEYIVNGLFMNPKAKNLLVVQGFMPIGSKITHADDVEAVFDSIRKINRFAG